jgi:hypothetical protein
VLFVALFVKIGDNPDLDTKINYLKNNNVQPTSLAVTNNHKLPLVLRKKERP